MPLEGQTVKSCVGRSPPPQHNALSKTTFKTNHCKDFTASKRSI